MEGRESMSSQRWSEKKRRCAKTSVEVGSCRGNGFLGGCLSGEECMQGYLYTKSSRTRSEQDKLKRADSAYPARSGALSLRSDRGTLCAIRFKFVIHELKPGRSV